MLAQAGIGRGQGGMRQAAILSLCGLAWGTAALAADPPPPERLVRHAGTGLAVALPPGFTGEVVEPMSGDVQINIAFQGQAACRVIYAARRGARPAPEALRTTVDTDAWRAELGRRLPQGNGAPARRFTAGEAIGGSATTDGAMPMSLYVLETPPGRTTLFCQSTESPAPRQRWATLAAGLRPPR
ncbi:hypothetical protein [Teichococcus deserti]|uniref:hypothetical protein n=1 Tax=Teichococcus deserti TaxID=1817963 RepID=UPI0010564987|nr:hypothetical protein [Pseudoroseomonas deserti]